MPRVPAQFPAKIWDGLSRNRTRRSRESQVHPNYADYDQIAAELIATQEAVAVIGVATTWEGEWDSSTEYDAGDLVEHNGSTYIATESNQASEPPSGDWDLVAAAGEPGAQGDPGPQGLQGEPGPALDLTTVWQGTWDVAVAYSEGDLVEHDGSTYIATAANEDSEPPSANWDLLASAGSQGDPGPALDLTTVWQGSWEGATPYGEGDLVERDGSTYIATAANEDSEPPSADWDIVASVGAQGEPGEPGVEWQGPWDPMTLYEEGDLVERDGSTYIAITSNDDSPPPSEHWELVALSGATSPVVEVDNKSIQFESITEQNGHLPQRVTCEAVSLSVTLTHDGGVVNASLPLFDLPAPGVVIGVAVDGQVSINSGLEDSDPIHLALGTAPLPSGKLVPDGFEHDLFPTVIEEFEGGSATFADLRHASLLALEAATPQLSLSAEALADAVVSFNGTVTLTWILVEGPEG